ncbi:MAG: hypothetical protein ACI8R4_002686 [Paracoccaceae bacterium]|jgi:hypothetical protein
MPGRAYSSSGIILQKVAVFCAAPWLVFTLPLTPVTRAKFVTAVAQLDTEIRAAVSHAADEIPS